MEAERAMNDRTDDHARKNDPTDDYPLGEDVTVQVHRRKPAGLVVSTRLEREMAERLLDMSEATSKTVSQLVREAVVAYLEHGGQGGASAQAAQVSMGTNSGTLNATFTACASAVTRSGLLVHTERMREIRGHPAPDCDPS